ncbi:hypothetical protein Pla52o_29620 [Novipirellula galeiformis]|uniref:Carboxypeptidase regulatory-like domain-containing protein n=1 Tax=Novipirellula galeiformis TaxID=2528004 RepID=A0A5C6CJZ5_9BACT|nr:hypothetical protein [Novipirellula galeiformis]TWU23426.1 hypothetical protein Pla52o_29620 [Novipirellula galeiformis]
MIQHSIRKSTYSVVLMMIVASLTTIVGCGSEGAGPGKYHVSGNVTFQGQPLPEGEILFTPDTAAGNRGPASIAYVKDGKYSTQPGKGLIGGAYRFEVEGFETKAEKDQDGEAIVAPMFQTFVSQHDFELQDSTFDFEVQVPAKKKR